MVLTLYCLDASPPVRAVYMTLSKLNITDVEYVQVDLLKGEHLSENYVKLNPQHTIPTLKDDDFAIWDSHAINAYLVAKYGEDDSLYPTDPKKRAIVDQRLHFDSGILFPALRRAVAPVLFFGEKSVNQESIDAIKSAYEFAEKFLTEPWMAGDELTLADICCVATVSTLDVLLPVNKEQYPNLWSWLQKCSELDIYKNGNEPGLSKFRALLRSKLE